MFHSHVYVYVYYYLSIIDIDLHTQYHQCEHNECVCVIANVLPSVKRGCAAVGCTQPRCELAKGAANWPGEKAVSSAHGRAGGAVKDAAGVSLGPLRFLSLRNQLSGCYFVTFVIHVFQWLMLSGYSCTTPCMDHEFLFVCGYLVWGMFYLWFCQPSIVSKTAIVVYTEPRGITMQCKAI